MAIAARKPIDVPIVKGSGSLAQHLRGATYSGIAFGAGTGWGCERTWAEIKINDEYENEDHQGQQQAI